MSHILSNSLRSMMQSVHFRRRRQRTNPEPDNRPEGHSPAASPFSPAHLQTSSARSSTRDNRRSPSNTAAYTETAQEPQGLLSTAAQSVEDQIEGSFSDGRGLSKILPSRPTADQGQSESPFPQAWQKLEEYSELNIVSLAGGVAALATTAFGGSTVVATMFALLRVVVRKVDNCIREDVHLARLTVKVNKLLDSFRKILDIMGPEIAQASRIILDGLAE
ncbi:uncharacterized protein ARMOST_05918 [Armillaria ostoyae]|uniref:Uncharacterized protein n=1 Tax=Armillaria ostoyae TaxID=47428 RepID=A0A284R1I9_ARMOS|nr:uncharacterized protein ARMOST_05918 [Armillaria ostoyae]